MAPHSNTLVWKIPWTENPHRLQSMGSLRDRHDWVTSFSLFTFMHWRRKWQPTIFLPGESHGQRNLVGYSPWSYKESDTTEWLTLTDIPPLLGFWTWDREVSQSRGSLESCYIRGWCLLSFSSVFADFVWGITYQGLETTVFLFLTGFCTVDGPQQLILWPHPGGPDPNTAKPAPLFIEPAQESNPMSLCFSCLTYFTQFENLQIHSCSCKWHYFILFYSRVVLCH